VDACLVKPVRQARLMETLISAWAKKHSTRIAPPDVQGSMDALHRHLERADGEARVLVVEDNAVNQKVALTILGKLGIRADVAGDGREGVELLKRRPYDVVFIDCQMPVMNGYEAVEEIRKAAGPNQRVAIIALTADAMQQSRERCLAAGMDDFITKPVKPDDFSRALERWLPDRVKPDFSARLTTQ
jgi:CheY-like chemotaxis protein